MGRRAVALCRSTRVQASIAVINCREASLRYEARNALLPVQCHTSGGAPWCRSEPRFPTFCVA